MKSSPTMIFPLIVSVTWLPRTIAPENSQIEAIIIVCFRVSAFAPTDVAKELATSLPPTHS